jgi:hypothetical protein
MNQNVGDIIRYIDAVEGRIDAPVNESGTIDLGMNTGGAEVDSLYSLDDGVRWLKIVEDHDSHWMIEHGWVDCYPDAEEFIYKQDLTEMIQDGVLRPDQKSSTQIVSESQEQALFESWLDKVDRYLLTNYDMEHGILDYPWQVAWAEDKTPYEASEEAVLL